MKLVNEKFEAFIRGLPEKLTALAEQHGFPAPNADRFDELRLEEIRQAAIVQAKAEGKTDIYELIAMGDVAVARASCTESDSTAAKFLYYSVDSREYGDTVQAYLTGLHASQRPAAILFMRLYNFAVVINHILDMAQNFGVSNLVCIFREIVTGEGERLAKLKSVASILEQGKDLFLAPDEQTNEHAMVFEALPLSHRAGKRLRLPKIVDDFSDGLAEVYEGMFSDLKAAVAEGQPVLLGLKANAPYSVPFMGEVDGSTMTGPQISNQVKSSGFVKRHRNRQRKLRLVQAHGEDFVTGVISGLDKQDVSTDSHDEVARYVYRFIRTEKCVLDNEGVTSDAIVEAAKVFVNSKLSKTALSEAKLDAQVRAELRDAAQEFITVEASEIKALGGCDFGDIEGFYKTVQERTDDLGQRAQAFELPQLEKSMMSELHEKVVANRFYQKEREVLAQKNAALAAQKTAEALAETVAGLVFVEGRASSLDLSEIDVHSAAFKESFLRDLNAVRAQAENPYLSEEVHEFIKAAEGIEATIEALKARRKLLAKDDLAALKESIKTLTAEFEANEVKTAELAAELAEARGKLSSSIEGLKAAQAALDDAQNHPAPSLTARMLFGAESKEALIARLEDAESEWHKQLTGYYKSDLRGHIRHLEESLETQQADNERILIVLAKDNLQLESLEMLEALGVMADASKDLASEASQRGILEATSLLLPHLDRILHDIDTAVADLGERDSGFVDEMLARKVALEDAAKPLKEVRERLINDLQYEQSCLETGLADSLRKIKINIHHIESGAKEHVREMAEYDAASSQSHFAHYMAYERLYVRECELVELCDAVQVEMALVEGKLYLLEQCEKLLDATALVAHPRAAIRASFDEALQQQAEVMAAVSKNKRVTAGVEVDLNPALTTAIANLRGYIAKFKEGSDEYIAIEALALRAEKAKAERYRALALKKDGVNQETLNKTHRDLMADLEAAVEETLPPSLAAKIGYGFLNAAYLAVCTVSIVGLAVPVGYAIANKRVGAAFFQPAEQKAKSEFEVAVKQAIAAPAA